MLHIVSYYIFSFIGILVEVSASRSDLFLEIAVIIDSSTAQVEN